MVFAEPITEIMRFLLAPPKVHLLILALISALAGVISHLKTKRRPLLLRRFPTPVPTEQRLVTAEAEVKKLQDKVGKLELTIARMKREQMIQHIISKAEKRVTPILETQISIFHEADVVGRPVYYVGGVPTVNIGEEVEQIARKFKVFPRRLIRRLYFGDGHTLYWWNTRLMPDGRWVIVAISKPPKIKHGKISLPRFVKKYVIFPSAQKKVDDMILNRYEVVTQGAAIQLAATVLGPFPVEKWLIFTTPIKERLNYGKEELAQPRRD